MRRLWQLYDEQGRILNGRGADKNAVFANGLLHGASHVWIWRKTKGGIEILLQKRSANKRTWPSFYDISAAGHIDLGESPFAAALRETKEELGIGVKETDLKLIGVQRAHITAPDGSIENEFQWLFTLNLRTSGKLNLQESEVALVKWKDLETFKIEVRASNKQYVPHSNSYFETVISAFESELATTTA